jgi:hypothetical protein
MKVVDAKEKSPRDAGFPMLLGRGAAVRRLPASVSWPPFSMSLILQ